MTSQGLYMPTPAKLVEVIDETPTIKTLVMAPDTPMEFKAGQFVQLTLPGTGEAPFTPSSSPLEPEQTAITILKTGAVTDRLHECAAGQTLGVRGPFGKGYPIDKIAGKEVLVVGGGDTAMDAAVTAKRAGAQDVSILYRRSFNEMPGSPTEKKITMDAGVHFVILTQPVDYVITDGKVTGVRVVRTRLGTPDDSGRRRPENLPDTEHVLAADLIIEAIGLTPDPSIRKLEALTIDAGERIQVNDAHRASEDLPLYAGGDAVRGASLVVKAVRDGKAAAAAIIKELGR